MMHGWRYPMSNSFHGNFFDERMIIMGVFGLAIIIGGFYLANKLINKSNQANQSEAKPTTQETALEITKKRYAKGEIDQAEFKEIKQELK